MIKILVLVLAFSLLFWSLKGFFKNVFKSNNKIREEQQQFIEKINNQIKQSEFDEKTAKTIIKLLMLIAYVCAWLLYCSFYIIAGTILNTSWAWVLSALLILYRIKGFLWFLKALSTFEFNGLSITARIIPLIDIIYLVIFMCKYILG